MLRIEGEFVFKSASINYSINYCTSVGSDVSKDIDGSQSIISYSFVSIKGEVEKGKRKTKRWKNIEKAIRFRSKAKI